ncbi:ribonuclease P protein component [Buchnera aphidicola]|nr:ribonuclease P protein component [Buchnera aphidicola]
MKLLTSLHFKYVFNQANKVQCKELIILERKNFLMFSRLGISISKKKIKNSCKRNKIKRVIRESFRLVHKKLINSDFVVVVNTCSLSIDSKLLAKKLGELWVYYYQ